MLNNPNTQRLFVGLWPNFEIRSRLTTVQTDFRLSESSRITLPEKFHITLLFLGDVPETEIASVKAFIQDIQFDPFSIELSCVGFWPGNRIIWAGTDEVSIELTELVGRVRKGLSRFCKDRRKFVPHITLARKAQKRIHGLIDPIHWQVHHIDLIRSTLLSDGAKYESIARSG